MNKLTLSLRFGFFIFIIFICLSILVSLLNSLSIKKDEFYRMEEQYAHLKESHINILTRELWLTDYEQLQSQINYMIDFEYVDHIKLIDEEQNKYEAGKFSPNLTITYSEILNYVYKNNKVPIGRIAIYYDYNQMNLNILKKFLSLFIMLLISSVLLSGITVIFFNSMIGRHIKALSIFLIKGQDYILANEFSLKRSRKLNDELSSLAESINSMRRNFHEAILKEKKLINDLEQQSEFRDKLFSIISHDLRGPLNSYVGLTGSMVEDFDNMPGSEIKMIISELHKSSESLTLLSENLLDWAKTNAKNLNVFSEPFLVDVITDTVKILLSGQLKEKEQSLKIDILETPIIFADKKMIETVLRNLVSNAIKFSPRGGSIEISAATENSKTIIEVRDSGTGISSEKITDFNLGKNISSDRGTENEKGTGLGLSICRQFIKLNNGKMEISQRDTGGTIISITLPSKNRIWA